MGAGLWFWIIYVMIFLLGGFWGYRDERFRPWLGPGVVVYILIGLLGWGVFGPPIR